MCPLLLLLRAPAVWPNDALASVAEQSLSDLAGTELQLRHRLAEQCVHFHLTARQLTERCVGWVLPQVGCSLSRQAMRKAFANAMPRNTEYSTCERAASY